MKRNAAVLILVATLAHSSSVWALDPQSVQAYCDEVKKASLDAQTRYIQAYQPRVDPGKTFDDATSSCLDFISNFNIGFSFNIPSLGDISGLLQQMAQKLLQRACQAAQQQFSKAVSDAQQSVGGGLNSVNQVPGVNVGVQTGNSGGQGMNVTGVIRDDGGSTLKNTATTAVDRVVNFLK